MAKEKKNYTDAVPIPQTIALRAIGVVHSPYTERHGTPRQSQLRQEPRDYVPVEARIELFADQIPSIALQDLEGFERIWVISFLHLNKNWNPTVRPPRGPKKRRGTLATRAPHRPNPIAFSAVLLRRIDGLNLFVEGIDLLQGTPILDIKPYVPYCDAFPNAKAGYVDELDASRQMESEIWGAKDQP